MASRALISWQTIGAARLDELSDAHLAISRAAVRRRQTEQLNKSLMMSLVAQFQKFCRDLHDAAVSVHVARAIPQQRGMLTRLMIEGRRLDTANPRPSVLGADFGRLGIPLVQLLRSASSRTAQSLERLDLLVDYRNAIGHADEAKMSTIQASGLIGPTKASFLKNRRTLDRLAITMDRLVSGHLEGRPAVVRGMEAKVSSEFKPDDVVDIDWGVHVISARVLTTYGEPPYGMVTMELSPDLSSWVVDEVTTLTLPEEQVRHHPAVA